MRRRDLLNLGAGTAALSLAELAWQRFGHPALGAEKDATVEPLGACAPAGDPLQALLDGNARFVDFESRYQQASSQAARQRLLADYWQDNCHLVSAVLQKGQAPWAGIITCADSRVPPSWIFDVNPGQLFVVRSAGNTAFDDGVASMEYAVANLGVSLIMVLGHSGCGAVSAALGDQPLTPLLEQLVQPIRAAVPRGVHGLAQAVEHNTRSAAESLTVKSRLLARGVEAGTLKIYGAVYDIANSRVQLV
ncbi:MAG: carbonic anhydrase [Cyanobacteria bacterium MAG APA_bin_95]|nr:carbonic anhydrase [Cyanobacteria bacterium MAG APA_bin_95]